MDENQNETMSNMTTNATDTSDFADVQRTIYILGRVVPVIFSIIFLVGVIGNGTLIYIVTRNKSMWNVPNIFIVSLAIGDLFLLVFSVPFHATTFMFTEWPFGSFMCKFSEYVATWSLGVSVFTLTLLSWDRYIAIVDPLRKHTGRPVVRTFTLAVCVWIVSALLAIMDGIGTGIVSHPIYDGQVLNICKLKPPDWGEWYLQFRTMFRFSVYFFIPICIIALFYSLMAKILISSSKDLPMEGKSDVHLRQIQARIKVAKVVLSFVVLFIVCWLPRHIYLINYQFEITDFSYFWLYFKIFSFCTCYVYSCINPLALYFLSKQFRYYYNKYLCCCCRTIRYSSLEATSVHANNFNSTVRRSSTTMTHLQAQTPC